MDSTTFYNFGSLINVFIILAGVIICVLTIKSGLTKALNEVQNNLIASLKTEIESLTRKVISLEKDNKKLETIMFTICEAMKRRGMDINIDGTMIRIKDNKDNSDLNIRIESD